MQIRRCEIAARGMFDRGLHHVGQAHGAETAQGFAPCVQRARHRDGFWAVEIFVVDSVEDVMRGARLRTIAVRLHHGRHRALPVDEAMAAVGGADMRHAAADDADHHRLDHRQREQRCDRGIDGVAAGRQHLGPSRGRQRMIAHHHATTAGRGPLLARESRCRPLAPVSAHDHSRLLCNDVSGICRRGQPHEKQGPDACTEALRAPFNQSGSISPEPPISAGKSLSFGRPSLIRKTVSP